MGSELIEKPVVHKCSGVKKRCTLLDRHLAKEKGAGLQLTVHTYVRFSREERSVMVIMYHATAESDGVAVNYCPWCGQKITKEITRRK